MFEVSLEKFRKMFGSVAMATQQVRGDDRFRVIHIRMKDGQLVVEATTGHWAMQWIEEPEVCGKGTWGSFLQNDDLALFLDATRSLASNERVIVAEAAMEDGKPRHRLSVSRIRRAGLGMSLGYAPLPSEGAAYPDIDRIFQASEDGLGPSLAFCVDPDLLTKVTSAFCKASGVSSDSSYARHAIAFYTSANPLGPIVVKSTSVPEIRALVGPVRADIPKMPDAPRVLLPACDCWGKRLDPVYSEAPQ